MEDTTIPVINVPDRDDSDFDSSTNKYPTDEDKEYSKGIVRNLKASEFPTNTSRKDLSGTIAKLELRYKRSKVSGAYPATLVHVRRWGPFRGTIDIAALVNTNKSKFICPATYSNSSNRTFDLFNHTGESSQKTGDSYASAVEIKDTDPTLSASRYYYPSAVAEFLDDTGLPTVKMKEGFVYDGDRDVDGTIDDAYEGLGNASNREELKLVPDTYYVYLFCVGDKPSAIYPAPDTAGKYVWNQKEIRVFRAMDLERPVVEEVENYGATPLVTSACQGQDDNRWGELLITAKIPKIANVAYDGSIGRLPNTTTPSGVKTIELHYITTAAGNGTSFIDNPDDPMGFKVDDVAENISIGYAYPITDDDGITPDTALKTLLETGAATFKFKTNEDYVKGEKTAAPKNSMIKDYLGELIPDTRGSKNTRIAFELLIKDRSIPASSSLSSAVFSHSLDTLSLLTGNTTLSSLSKMSGASFIRGETVVENNNSDCKGDFTGR